MIRAYPQNQTDGQTHTTHLHAANPNTVIAESTFPQSSTLNFTKGPGETHESRPHLRRRETGRLSAEFYLRSLSPPHAPGPAPRRYTSIRWSTRTVVLSAAGRTDRAIEYFQCRPGTGVGSERETETTTKNRRRGGVARARGTNRTEHVWLPVLG